MFDPEPIVTWITTHVNGMRRSRQKTLAAVVSAAMHMKGVGVLALGRAMAGVVGAKHYFRHGLRECQWHERVAKMGRATERSPNPTTPLSGCGAFFETGRLSAIVCARRCCPSCRRQRVRSSFCATYPISGPLSSSRCHEMGAHCLF